jgi:hypothetical protein
MFKDPQLKKASMRRLLPFVLVLSLSAGMRASAQLPEWVTQILAAARLPVSALEARRAGVPDSAVRAVLDAMQRRQVPPGDAKDVLDEERADARQHGPIDNFGAFVQSRLDAGLRGRDLAAAIRAEHEARGNVGADRGNARDRAATHGQSGSHPTGQSGIRNPPARKGPPSTKGPPATKGRPTTPDRS